MTGGCAGGGSGAGIRLWERRRRCVVEYARISPWAKAGMSARATPVGTRRMDGGNFSRAATGPTAATTSGSETRI